ncbi:MAG: trypsin-like peptidase domain-containing protein [Limnochordales bacterium]|nr:trypsin-like peptidase domain-containing protein [Limnochordales bacterium]
MRSVRQWFSKQTAVGVTIALIAFFAGAILVSKGYIPAPIDRAYTEGSADGGAGGLVAEGGSAGVNTALSAGVQALTSSGIPMTQYTVADVADRVSPSVAYIEVRYSAQSVAGRGRARITDPFDEFWRYFFFGPSQPLTEEIQPSVGSGVVVSSDGYILTNQHVVDVPAGLKVSKISVTIPGYDEPLEAELVGADRELDLAVLKVNPKRPLPQARLGDSDAVRVGEWVVAIGNPFELDHTVTVGVVSAKDRELEIPDEQGTVRRYKQLMQTDAAINPGNSGGPLVNLRGEVIGINTAVLDSSVGQGIGFAIPINAAKNMINQVLKSGKYVRPWIGISYGPLTDEVREYFGIPKSVTGVIVGEVYPDSPAAKAGLKSGDVITEVNRKKITDQDTFGQAIANMKPGDRLSFLLWRDGKIQVATVTVGERPADL